MSKIMNRQTKKDRQSGRKIYKLRREETQTNIDWKTGRGVFRQMNRQTDRHTNKKTEKCTQTNR